MEDNQNDKIIKCDISSELRDCYLDYAMSVIVSRAIPDCRDGLKPVQRRILYSMKELGIGPSVKFKKCALVVGHTMGRYHPHGDMAIYDTLVRMAQPFSLRYTLVNGQGNFGCFTGDTKIRLADGRNLSFIDLINEQQQGKKHWGFAFNTDEKRIVITEILKPRKTRENQELIEITLDNEEKIKCTLNHKFMIRNGEYVEAQDLKEGDSLMPLYIDKYEGNDKNLKEYEIVMQPTTGDWDFVHQLSDKWNLDNKVYEKAEGRIRHHIDFNKYNNSPDNIQRIQWGDHWKLHKEIASSKHKTDPEYVEKLRLGRAKYWSNDENKEKAAKRMADANKRNWKNPKYREEKINSIKSLWQDPEMREFFKKNSSDNLKKLWNTPEFQKLMSASKSKEMKLRWQDPEYRKEQSMRMKDISKKLWLNPEHRKHISEASKKFNEKHPEFQKIRNDGWMNKWNNDEAFRQKNLEVLTSNGKQNQKCKFIAICTKVLLQCGSINEENYKLLYKNYGGNCAISFERGLENYFNNDLQALNQCVKEKIGTPVNHKIKKIKFLKEFQDVYDITTTPWHNFALASGVFVHNSVDGDPAASSRYTECRMMAIADEMFNDIEKETIDLVPNYDNSLKEPKVLPTKVPQLLLNGTTGIAVGMATNIPPHHLGECMDAAMFLADNPNCNTDDLMQFVKGPDFPTGGTIYGWNEIKEAYSTGKGRILMRGTAEIVDGDKNRQIVISEIPYMVNKSELIKKIANLIEDKKIINIKDIRDESDKKGLTITIDLKKEANPKSILNQLYKYTDLEKCFHVNSIALIEDGLQPELLSLKDILNEFLSFRKKVIFRRTQFLLRKAKERLHILEGLKTALDHIDEIIEIIKKSENKEDANLKLCKKFKFTEIQANVILETKLQAIAKLEKIKILNELKEKQDAINEYEGILKDEKKIVKIMKQEFTEIKEKFNDERRTKVVKGMPDKIEETDLIPDENVLITLSQNGYIKRMNSNMFRTQQRGGKGITAYNAGENDLLEHILNVSTKDNLLFFSDKGKVYQTNAYDINDASRESKGKAIQNFIDISSDENISVVLGHNKEVAKNKKYLIMATRNGVIKKTELTEFQNIRKNGLLSIKLEKDDLLKWADFSSGDDSVCLVTEQGQSIMFSEKDVRSMGRSSSGVTGIKLSKGDKVVGMMVINKSVAKTSGAIVSLSQFGFGKKTLIKEYRLQKRGGAGIKNFKITAKTGLLVASKLATNEEILVNISKKGLILQTELQDIPCLSRTTQGVKIMRLDEGDEVSEIILL